MLLQNCLLLLHTKLIPLFFSIAGFGLLVIIHELGHFLFCKLFGVHTPTFSIGFGPKLFERKIGATNFRLSAIPFGGYVEMAGNAEIGQGEQLHADATGNESFASKPYWQKLLIMLGGILFNILSAYIIFCTLFFIGDSLKISVVNIAKDSAAERAELRPGDRIIGINKVSLLPEEGVRFREKYDLLFQEIAENPKKKIKVKILRDNEELTQSIMLGEKEKDGKMIGSLGAGFNPPPIEKVPFTEAIAEGISYTNKLIYDISAGIKRMLTNIFSPKGLEGAGGPVAIISMGFKTAQTSFISLFIFLAMMSVNLGLFNLLPLGVLDGGQILFVTIEAIIRRPTPDWFKVGINLISLISFALLFIYLTYKDIMGIFGEPLMSAVQTITSMIGF